MSEITVKYEDRLRAALTDPEEAAAYLNAAIEDGDPEVFELALRDVAKARGVNLTPSQAQPNRESLHGTLSSAANPQLIDLNALLRSVGLRLAVEVDQRRPAVIAIAEAQADYQVEAN